MYLQFTMADETEKHYDYIFSAATLKKYADASTESTTKKAITLTVSGLSALGEAEIDVRAFVRTAIKFEQARACVMAQ